MNDFETIIASLKKDVETAKHVLREVSLERDGKVGFDDFVEVMR